MTQDFPRSRSRKAGFKIHVARSVTVAASGSGTFRAAAAGCRSPPAGPGPLLRPLAAGADPAKHPGAVKSPMVGAAYRSPDPRRLPFVGLALVFSRVIRC